MSPAKKGTTAAELIARLNADPEWIRQNAEREAKHNSAVEQLARELEPEESPLRAELAKAGYDVESLSYFVNTKERYPEAIPIFAKFLPMARHPVLREVIARALSVRYARGICGDMILKELTSGKDPRGSQERWALVNALTVLAEKHMVEDLERLLADPNYDDVHNRMKDALRKATRERAKCVGRQNDVPPKCK